MIGLASVRQRYRDEVAASLASFARFFDAVVFVADGGEALALRHPRAITVDTVAEAATIVAALDAERVDPILVVLYGTANHSDDIEGELHRLSTVLPRSARVALVAFSPYLRWAYQAANITGVRRGQLPSTFVTRTDIENLAALAGFAVARVEQSTWPAPPLPSLQRLSRAAAALLPPLKGAALTWTIVLRPVKKATSAPSLSVVIPARNERGNIQAALDRLRGWDRSPLEILFVEGNSSDGTWDEIQRAITAWDGPHSVRALKQTGKGKADAVRLGFSHASGELLTILDADLTMPPELLHRFYDAWVEGHGDFINGSRLVYPMEDDSMRFLNRLGNVFFARAVSFVLDDKFGDTLCGTKLLRRRDYERFVRWREEFGDFDPFGDFELLFPAAILALGIIDVPIRYRARTYGETNIQRFRHGAELLRMTAVGLTRVKMSRGGGT